MHDVVRRLCLDHIEKERDHFSPYVTQDFDAYVARKRRDRTHGNHVEIQAISEIYNRPVHVFDATSGDAQQPMNTFSGAPSDGEPSAPLRLSYHGRNHYNVIFDPTHADAGVGLGLPSTGEPPEGVGLGVESPEGVGLGVEEEPGHLRSHSSPSNGLNWHSTNEGHSSVHTLSGLAMQVPTKNGEASRSAHVTLRGGPRRAPRMPRP